MSCDRGIRICDRVQKSPSYFVRSFLVVRRGERIQHVQYSRDPHMLKTSQWGRGGVRSPRGLIWFTCWWTGCGLSEDKMIRIGDLREITYQHICWQIMKYFPQVGKAFKFVVGSRPVPVPIRRRR